MAENGAIKDRIKSLRRVRVSELQAHPKNWRKHPDSQRRAMSAALSEIGFADALLVRETPDGLQIIDGHLRADLAKDQKVPVLVLDVDEQEAEKLLATFDAITGLAEIDEDILRSLADGLEFEMPELDELVAGLLGDEPAEIVEDEIPEVQESAPVTQRGDKWACGRHRVVCGDCTDEATVAVLLGDARLFIMVTDPPYGVEYEGEKGSMPNDDRADWSAAFHLFNGDVAYVWHAERFAIDVGLNMRSSGLEIRGRVVWVKPSPVLGRGHYNFQHEGAWYAVRGGRTSAWVGDMKQSTVWSLSISDEAHPTAKPVECMARPIQNHGGPDDHVYDPFLGSGTTLIAAEQLGRTCYGIEIEPRYVDVILQRYMNFTNVSPRRKRDGALFSELVKAEAVTT